MRWVGLAALVCAARIAYADSGDIGVLATGDAKMQAKVVRHLEDWVKKQGKKVRDPLSASALNTFTDCFVMDDLKCARGVFEARSKTGSLAFVRVERDGTKLTFDIYWFVKGREAIAEPRVCDKCSDDAWQSVLEAKLTNWLADPKLVPVIKEEEPLPNKQRGSRWFAASLLGVGVASIATGGTFVYLGERDGREHKWLYTDATPVGLVLVAVGVGATIGGSILLIQSGSSRSAPVAALTPDGGYLGWVTRF